MAEKDHPLAAWKDTKKRIKGKGAKLFVDWFDDILFKKAKIDPNLFYGETGSPSSGGSGVYGMWLTDPKKDKSGNKVAAGTELGKVINALKKMNISKVSIFTPYSKKLNDEVVNYFKKENFTVTSNSYFDILIDGDIAKIDPEYLYEVVLNMDLGDAEAVFLSCTNLPALSIIEKLEKKLNRVVLTSNQVLIWDTLQNIGKNKTIRGFGKLFLNN